MEIPYLSAEQGIERYDTQLPTYEGITTTAVILERAIANTSIRVLDIGSYGEYLREVKQELNNRYIGSKAELISIAAEDGREEQAKEYDQKNGLTFRTIDFTQP